MSYVQTTRNPDLGQIRIYDIYCKALWKIPVEVVTKSWPPDQFHLLPEHKMLDDFEDNWQSIRRPWEPWQCCLSACPSKRTCRHQTQQRCTGPHCNKTILLETKGQCYQNYICELQTILLNKIVIQSTSENRTFGFRTTLKSEQRLVRFNVVRISNVPAFALSFER